MSNDPGLLDTMYHCRAMRRLDSREVPEELLIKMIDAANQAPSGSNNQRARWIVVRDTEQKRRLAALNKTSVDAYIGPDSGRADELPHQSSAKRERMRQAVIWQAEHMHEVPALVIACFEFDGPVTRTEAVVGATFSIS